MEDVHAGSRGAPGEAVSLQNGPGEGSWSVFAEKVVAERDQLRAEVRELKRRVAKARKALTDTNLDWSTGYSRALEALAPHRRKKP